MCVCVYFYTVRRLLFILHCLNRLGRWLYFMNIDTFCIFQGLLQLALRYGSRSIVEGRFVTCRSLNFVCFWCMAVSLTIIPQLPFLYSSTKVLFTAQLNTHEVRTIASSWNVFNAVSMTEVLSAGFWRSESTFYNYDLRSMPQHCDNLYSLEPLISAQQIIFPPTRPP